MTARVEKYTKEYADQDRAVIDAKRSAKNAGNIFVEDEAKLAFVIRTRGYVTFRDAWPRRGLTI